MLESENRKELAQKYFEFLPTRIELDLMGWEQGIFQEEGLNEISIKKPKEIWIENRADVHTEHSYKIYAPQKIYLPYS